MALQSGPRDYYGNDWLNVKWFGATGDGQGDDTNAFQNALNEAHSLGGATVFMPDGKYEVSDITLHGSTRLTGNGNSILSGLSSSVPAVVNIDTSATKVVLDHFVVNANALGSVDCVYFNNTGVAADSLHRLFNVWAYNAGGYGIHMGAAVIETNIIGCFAFNSKLSGFYTEVGATDSRYISCSAGSNGGHGFLILGNNNHYVGCKAYYSGQYNYSFTDGYNGFMLAPAANEDLHAVLLTSCEAQNNARDGFHIDGSASGASCDYIVGTNLISDGNNGVGTTGSGFAMLNVTNSKFTNLINRNQTSWTTNYGLALFDNMAGTTIDGAYLQGSVGPVYFDRSLTGAYKLSNVTPYNPVGKLGSPPSVPASGTAYMNVTGVDCSVLVSGGTVSAIAIGGNSTGLTSGWFPVPAGQTITLTYSAAPTWTWWGN